MTLFHAGSVVACALRTCGALPTATVVVPAHASFLPDVPLLVFVCPEHRAVLVVLLGAPHVRDFR